MGNKHYCIRFKGRFCTTSQFSPHNNHFFSIGVHVFSGGCRARMLRGVEAVAHAAWKLQRIAAQRAR
jgi:hypothetical protein